MVDYREDTAKKIRDKEVDPLLRSILIQAGEEAGVDLVRVTSGGQCKLGVCSKRTGSTRHDDGKAADLQLWVGGEAQDFSTQEGLMYFRKFARACARLGATGIGAGKEYMGNKTIHIGFGSRSVWGPMGSSALAPSWLTASVQEGWRAPSSTETIMLTADAPEDCRDPDNFA